MSIKRCSSVWLCAVFLVASSGARAAASPTTEPITVTSSGIWIDPVTTSTSVVTGVGTSTVTWGTPASGSFSSQLTFRSLTNQVRVEQEFRLGTLELRNGAILLDTEISGINLNLTVGVNSQPLNLIQSFDIENTLNSDTGTPSQNADYIRMGIPASGTITIDSQQYSLTILGFLLVDSAEGASPAMHTLSAFEESTVTTELWAILSREGCVGPTVIKDIYFGFPCPPGATQGIWSRDAKSGERLVGKCNRGEYSLCYRDADGVSFQVGRCPYGRGCNEKWYTYVETQGEIDCFLGTMWRSYDAGTDDDGDSFLDIAEYDFSTPRVEDLKESIEEHLYNPPAPPLDCRRLREQMGPALPWPGDPAKPASGGTGCGPIRGESPGDLQSSPQDVMEEVGWILCDLDSDGDCDTADRTMIQGAMGECVGDPGYLPSGDVDGNGCVSPRDEYLLFGQDLDLDEIPDAGDNCPEHFNPSQADADGNLIGDVCEGLFSDGFESGDTQAWSSTVEPRRSVAPTGTQ